MNIRGHGRRFAWLMTGAAIGTTVVLVLLLVVPTDLDLLPSPRRTVLGILLAVVIGGVLGLVPGVRELEVTASRSMLGVESELVVPRRPGLVHRVQDVLWVQLHLLLGLLAAACLTMLLPASVVVLVEVVGMRSDLSFLSVPDSLPGRVGIGILALLAAVTALLSAWPLGALASCLAPRLLGPTARDRLELALARVSREAERTRIARDLHDGIGHALTIVSIQAAAGGHVLDRDPGAAREALARIETTAREALVDLDGVLAGLRDERTGPVGTAGTAGALRSGGADDDAVAAERADEAATRRLDALVGDHRDAGMDLRTEVELPVGVPTIQHEHLARLVTELLTNAHRHGGDGPVHLGIRTGRKTAGADAVIVETTNPLVPPATAAPSAARPDSSRRTGLSPGAGTATSPSGGRGLSGLRERLALWGGTLEAGPHDGSWRARAVVPILRERGSDDS